MLRFNKTINNGPPTIAIIIADEISYGAMITLPRVSALNNVIAPSNIQIGIKYLWSFPINNLEMCGTKRPIKPMTPTTATLIPVSYTHLVPEAYPISETIPVVKKRTELNGKGTFTEFPATSKIAIASPIALPTPRTIAETIPDLALGKTCLLYTSRCV